MSRTREQEKAYNEKRAEMLRGELEAAIKDRDKERFIATYEKLLSHSYVSAKERKALYTRFIEEVIVNETNNAE